MKKAYGLVILTVISLTSLLSMLYIFWWSLLIGYDLYGMFVFRARMDKYNEFWFEFITLHLLLIVVVYVVFKTRMFSYEGLRK